MRLSRLLRSAQEAAAGAGARRRLTLYTGGPECSLCEVAKDALDELRSKVWPVAVLLSCALENYDLNCMSTMSIVLCFQPEGVPFQLETVNIRDRSDPETKRWRRLYQVSWSNCAGGQSRSAHWMSVSMTFRSCTLKANKS